MKRVKLIFLIILFFIYSFIVNSVYRPYIYREKIYDFGVADIGNNIAFVPGIYLLSYLINRKFLVSKYLDIWLCFILFATVEIISYFIPFFGTFDFKDIIGLLFGAFLIYFIVKYDN